MKSNPLNNKYSIYYLLYEYITNTQCNIYWIIANSRVSFIMLLLLKIRVIIELFMSDPPTKIMALWIIMPLFRPFDIAAERYHLIKMRILRNEEQPFK